MAKATETAEMVKLTVVSKEPPHEEPMIDYAYPCMMAEKAIKDLHNAMLAKKYTEALVHAETALVEVRLTAAAVRHMQEKDSK
jgi:hypothetical protein